jgi:hypothetical protein
LTESNFALYRSIDGGATWTDQGGTLSAVNNTLTKTGIPSFSRWTVGDTSLPLNLLQPTITFGAAPTPTYLGGNFTVSASTTNTDSSALTYSRVSGPCAFVSGATFSSAGAGTCVVQADGAATTNFLAASNTQSVAIGRAGTITTIASDTPDPSVMGQSIAVAYVVTANPPGGTPTGSVTVSDGVNTCSDTVATGSCSLLLTTIGARTLTATYAGDSNFNGSSGTASHDVLNNSVTIAAATGNGNITIETSSAGCGFTSWGAKTEAQVANDPSFDYYFGLVEFALNCAVADVTITYPGSIAGTTYRKYGPTTPGDGATTAWYTFGNVTINSSTTITLHLRDGELGDDTAVDGIIVDQGGPGAPLPPAPVPTMSEWGMILFLILAGICSAYYLKRRGTPGA